MALAGVNPARIAQLSLDALTTVGIPLNAFVTDLSPDIKSSGDSVTTRFATVPSTVDFDSAKTAASGTTTARPVTLNQYRGVPIKFKDTEVAYSDVQLMDLFIVPAISVLVEEMLSHALANVNAANGFDTLESVILPTALDADAVATLGQGLSTRKVPRGGRSLIIKPTYHVTLAKDNVITASSDGPSGTTPIRESRVPRIHGFDVHEYCGSIPANDINLAGLACAKQALIIAARVPALPTNWYGHVQNITDPNSGLTLQFRAYYDGTNQIYEWCTIYGTAVGIKEYATPIVSV